MPILRPTWLQRTPRQRRLFFVRGHPRSGTNWVGALLNLHPQIDCRGEFHFEELRKTIDALQSHHWHLTGREPVRGVLEAGFYDLVRRCIEAQCTQEPVKPHALLLGDRTPRLLRPMIPGASYILIVRDGRDVLVSWTFHLLRLPPEVIDTVVYEPLREAFQRKAAAFRAEPEVYLQRPMELFSDEGWVRHAARGWAERVRADAAVAGDMRAGRIDGAVHVVQYESLHAETESQRRGIYAFLGVDPGGALPVSPETRTSAGFAKHDPASFFRHGAVGDWRKFAHDRFRTWFNESAGAALLELGYEKTPEW